MPNKHPTHGHFSSPGGADHLGDRDAKLMIERGETNRQSVKGNSNRSKDKSIVYTWNENICEQLKKEKYIFIYNFFQLRTTKLHHSFQLKKEKYIYIYNFFQ